jgi:hypothetical protein
VVKPYSRKQIANKLDEANKKRQQLNTRQAKELDFYLKDFNKELLPGKDYKKRLDFFYYKDSLFTFLVNPILGGQYYKNENGSAYHRWDGADAFAYIGNHWAFYSSLRDNHESKRMSGPLFLNQNIGANYKSTSDGGADYSEMRGGITYTWTWGSIGIVKDHFVWGDNYNGANIFSGKTPSFVAIKLYAKPAKWFEFNYFHGWLVSNVIDSSRSYTFVNSYGKGKRDVMVGKYLAANLFTFIPWKNLHVSFGNSIVYSDIGVQPAYLIPVLFYKSVDHWLSSVSNIAGQNSQMFFDVSSRQIKNLHLYGTWFLDELNIANMFIPSKQSNFFSIKLGACLSNFSIQNVSLITEYTRTNPLAFQHDIPSTTFQSNGYNLGYYLQDNSQEIFLSLRIKPIKALRIEVSYTNAKRGKDYTELGGSGLGLPFMDTVKWKNIQMDCKISYQFINDLYLFGEYAKGNMTGDPRYSPALFQGKTNTFSFGLNLGF